MFRARAFGINSPNLRNNRREACKRPVIASGGLQKCAANQAGAANRGVLPARCRRRHANRGEHVIGDDFGWFGFGFGIKSRSTQRKLRSPAWLIRHRVDDRREQTQW